MNVVRRDLFAAEWTVAFEFLTVVAASPVIRSITAGVLVAVLPVVFAKGLPAWGFIRHAGSPSLQPWQR